MKHKNCIFLLIAVLLFCTGCSDTAKKEETPTTITVWHVYGGQTDSPLNDLIEEFNQTVGKEQQINVQVTSVSNTNTIHELVLAAANGEPGASELPDLFKLYRREYKKRFAWIKAGKISQEDFYAWSEQAREKKTACEAGTLSVDKFGQWLKES